MSSDFRNIVGHRITPKEAWELEQWARRLDLVQKLVNQASEALEEAMKIMRGEKKSKDTQKS